MSVESELTERSLIDLWIIARWHLIVSQVAPTILLIVTIGLLDAGLTAAPLIVRIAAAGILLAAGILGSLVQLSATGEALAVIDDLDAMVAPSAVSARIIASRRWIAVPRFVTPTIFVVVFIAILASLFLLGR